MKNSYRHWIAFPALVLLVGVSSISLVTRMASQSQSGSCNDPIQNCKKPVYVGSNGRCSCFTCEDGSVVCTDKPKNKLELYEAEALHRDTEGLIRSLPQSQKDRLAGLGIGREDLRENLNLNLPNVSPRPGGSVNANAAPSPSPQP